MGIASLVVSIIAIILSLIPLVGLPVAIIALILAIVAMCRKKNKEVYRGLKIAGLVISIIAMAISTLVTAPIAIGAYIVSKNSQEIIDKADEAVLQSELANVRNACMLVWADAIRPESNGVAVDENGEVVTAEYYYNYLVTKDFGTKTELKKKYTIIVNSISGTPKVEINTSK